MTILIPWYTLKIRDHVTPRSEITAKTGYLYVFHWLSTAFYMLCWKGCPNLLPSLFYVHLCILLLYCCVLFDIYENELYISVYVNFFSSYMKGRRKTSTIMLRKGSIHKLRKKTPKCMATERKRADVSTHPVMWHAGMVTTVPKKVFAKKLNIKFLYASCYLKS